MNIKQRQKTLCTLNYVLALITIKMKSKITITNILRIDTEKYLNI